MQGHKNKVRCSLLHEVQVSQDPAPVYIESHKGFAYAATSSVRDSFGKTFPSALKPLSGPTFLGSEVVFAWTLHSVVAVCMISTADLHDVQHINDGFS